MAAIGDRNAAESGGKAVSPVATQEPAAKVNDEHDYLVEEVEGALPDGLHGTLYRIGPGKFESGGQPLGHLWDGDGLLSMFVLDGGVRFRSRYVRTNHYRAG